MEKKLWKERLCDGLDLPDEPIPGMPLIELAGEHRVLIECHGGITQYSDEKICVKVRYGQVCIQGRTLELTCMTRERLVITGNIDGVALWRRET